MDADFFTGNEVAISHTDEQAGMTIGGIGESDCRVCGLVGVTRRGAGALTPRLAFGRA